MWVTKKIVHSKREIFYASIVNFYSSTHEGIHEDA